VFPNSPRDAALAEGAVDAQEEDRLAAVDDRFASADTVDSGDAPSIPDVPQLDAPPVVDVPVSVDVPSTDTPLPGDDVGCAGPTFGMCGGACVPLTTTANCGSCGLACAFANATATCASGCRLATCLPSRGNCDGVEANGCEADLATSRDHCGTCGHRCGAGNCEAGACQPCAPGMRLIPTGEFLMGSSANASERPAHRVRLTAFCLEEVEVTVAAYRACVTAGACTAPTTALSPNWNVAGREEHPMNNVNWSQARAYCQWRGRDLPTEAQWEYAARGSDDRTYPWGGEAPAAQSCWNRMTSPGSSCPVRGYPATQFGLFDMSGNVWEWTRDWYGPYAATAGATPVDPTGPSTGTMRVFRGGSWYVAVHDTMRAAVRYQNTPAYSVGDIGIRCAAIPSATP
jgi:formylglycine-generating enzyme required for sulfatase activity